LDPQQFVHILWGGASDPQEFVHILWGGASDPQQFVHILGGGVAHYFRRVPPPRSKVRMILRNQIWDKYHFSGTQLWLRAHGSAEKNNNRAWCARCMDHFERYWNICAKTACGRVHPVAVVTASSRISRNKDWQRAAVLLGRSSGWMNIGQPSHGGARWWSTVGHPAREFRDIRLLAVTTATGWTRPRAGFAPMVS